MRDICLSQPDETRALVDGRWQLLPDDVRVCWQGNDLLLSAEHTRVECIGFRWYTGFCADARFFGDAWERGYGDLGWQGIRPERVMPWYMMIREGDLNSFLAVKTGCHAFVGWMTDSHSVTLLCDTRSGNQGVLLGKRTLTIGTFHSVFNQAGNAYHFLCEQVRGLCDHPILPKKPVYGGNNWYYAYGHSSAQQILSDTGFIAEMAEGNENRPFMVIDDGWQLNADHQETNGGPWRGNIRFGAMQDLAAQIKQMNVKPGLWLRPLLWDADVDPSWVLRREKIGYTLDPSVPAVLDQIRETMHELSSWGFELLKHDFTCFDLMGGWGRDPRGDRLGRPSALHDTARTNAEITIALYDAIRSGAGTSMVLGCNTVSHLAAGRFEIQRTGDDTSGRDWERTRRMGINTLAMRMPQHNAFYACDADCVGSTDAVPWDLNEQWLHLLAHSGTPLFVSANAALQKDRQRKKIHEAFRIASLPHNAAIPLDWERTTCPVEWMLYDGKHQYNWSDWYTPETKSVWWR